MSLNFLAPFNWIKFTQQQSCQNTRIEWYLAESDVGGRDVARKNIWRGFVYKIIIECLMQKVWAKKVCNCSLK